MPGARRPRVKVLNSFAGHNGVYDVAFSPDGRFIATSGFDGLARLWYTDPVGPYGLLRDDRVAQTFSGHQGIVTAVAFHPTEAAVATASGDETVRLWDEKTGRQLHAISHPAKVADVAFNPDGRRLG